MEINGNSGIFIGGASGMALATAEKFKAGGGNVAILDLPSSDGAAVAERLGGTFHECNVMDYEGAGESIAAAANALGSVHFCVFQNFLGILDVLLPLFDLLDRLPIRVRVRVRSTL